jgi:hypothetical protein
MIKNTIKSTSRRQGRFRERIASHKMLPKGEELRDR